MTHTMGLEKWIPNSSPPKNYVHVFFPWDFLFALCCVVLSSSRAEFQRVAVSLFKSVLTVTEF